MVSAPVVLQALLGHLIVQLLLPSGFGLQNPRVSLTALKDGAWYTHISVRAALRSGATIRISSTSTGCRVTTGEALIRTAFARE